MQNQPHNILLGVSGGIAAYKACDLARQLVKAGCSVQVVMTESATQFVTPLSFQALTGAPARVALFDAAHEAAMGHIELARWPDAIVIAPASANTLARIAHGFAGDLLSTLALATDKPIFVAPAMNRLMWANPATQANMAALAARGVHVLGPGAGEQACGEVGEGRMWEPQQIAEAVLAALRPAPQLLAGVRAVVTAGPTREPLDPVRFITNRSSGKQGYAVAAALKALGAEVCLLSGPTNLPCPAGVQRKEIETAAELLAASLDAARTADLFVAAAAVADYRAATVASEKIKKSDAELTMSFAKNPDILMELRAAYPKLFMVGFAAETQALAEHARGKLQRKGLQMIAANWVGNGRAFDAEDNALSVFTATAQQEIPHGPKTEVARALALLIAQHYSAAKLLA